MRGSQLTNLSRLLFGLATVFMLLGVMGCKTTEADNVSTQPWNNTQGWSSGFPAGLNEGR